MGFDCWICKSKHTSRQGLAMHMANQHAEELSANALQTPTVQTQQPVQQPVQVPVQYSNAPASLMPSMRELLELQMMQKFIKNMDKDDSSQFEKLGSQINERIDILQEQIEELELDEPETPAQQDEISQLMSMYNQVKNMGTQQEQSQPVQQTNPLELLKQFKSLPAPIKKQTIKHFAPGLNDDDVSKLLEIAEKI